MSPKQPLPGMRLHVPLSCEGKLPVKSISLYQGFSQIFPLRETFRAGTLLSSGTALRHLPSAASPPYKQYITIHQYITLQYTTIHHNTLQYTTLRYNTLHYNTLHYNTLNYTTIHYNTPQYTTMHYITLQYTTSQYTTIHYNTPQ